MEDRGLQPRLNWLENESQKNLRDYLTDKGITYQLVQPHCHRRNTAERHIRTFKNHFITILSTIDPSLPMYLWRILIAQAVLTLNLLRKSNINPKLSLEAQLNGKFDYNITPLDPARTVVVAHKKPSQQGSRSVLGARGWYLVPDPNHCTCFEVYTTNTGQTRVVDKVEFYPEKYKTPTLSTRKIPLKAAFELTKYLQNIIDKKIQFNNNELKDIQKISTIFTDIAASKVFESMSDKQLPRVEKYSQIIA